MQRCSRSLYVFLRRARRTKTTKNLEWNLFVILLLRWATNSSQRLDDHTHASEWLPNSIFVRAVGLSVVCLSFVYRILRRLLHLKHFMQSFCSLTCKLIRMPISEASNNNDGLALQQPQSSSQLVAKATTIIMNIYLCEPAKKQMEKS